MGSRGVSRAFLVFLLLLLAGAVAGCSGGGATPGAGVVATAQCEALEAQRVQTGSHLLDPDGEPPVPYTSSPPTSGWHALGLPPVEAYAEPISDPAQVSILEGGAVIAAYAGLGDGDVAELESLAREFSGRLATTPYPALDDGEVVLTTWGALQRCDGLDPEAVRTFVTAFAVPDPGAPTDH